MSRILILAILLMSFSLPAVAQTDAPDNEGGRFSLNKVDDGYLRLDQRSGQVSLCTKRTSAWACYPVPDERAALEDEIGRLQKENAGLKKEMLARGVTLPGMKQPPAKPDSGADSGLKVPSDAELDKAMAVMERIWKRLVEMVQRVQKELAPPI